MAWETLSRAYLEVLSFVYVYNWDGGYIGIQNCCHFRLIFAFWILRWPGTWFKHLDNCFIGSTPKHGHIHKSHMHCGQRYSQNRFWRAAILENGGHFTFGIFLVISKLLQWIIWLPKHGLATITKALCAIQAEIWSNIVLNCGHVTLGIFLVIRNLFQWILWPPKRGCGHKYEGSLCNTGWDMDTIKVWMAAILKNGRHLFRAAYLPGCPPRKCSGRCPKHVDTKQPFTAFHVRLTPLAPWVWLELPHRHGFTRNFSRPVYNFQCFPYALCMQLRYYGNMQITKIAQGCQGGKEAEISLRSI